MGLLSTLENIGSLAAGMMGKKSPETAQPDSESDVVSQRLDAVKAQTAITPQAASTEGEIGDIRQKIYGVAQKKREAAAQQAPKPKRQLPQEVVTWRKGSFDGRTNADNDLAA